MLKINKIKDVHLCVLVKNKESHNQPLHVAYSVNQLCVVCKCRKPQVAGTSVLQSVTSSTRTMFSSPPHPYFTYALSASVPHHLFITCLTFITSPVLRQR